MDNIITKTYSGGNSVSLLGFIIAGIIIAVVIFTKNNINNPERCSGTDGLIYSNNDFGSIFGLGGYKCGVCSPKELSYVDDKGYCKQCDSGKYWDGGQCVSCYEGQVLDAYTHECKCDKNRNYFPYRGGCIKCDSNKGFLDGKCINCSGGTVVGGVCTCPSTSYLNDVSGDCVLCPSGQIGSSAGCRIK
jgi:hypothetical protein